VAVAVTAQPVLPGQREFEDTLHDRSRSQLRNSVYAWTESSHILGNGDRVKVTDIDHACFDRAGTVIGRNDNMTQYNVRMDEMVEGRLEGYIDRTKLTKMHCHDSTFRQSTLQVERNMAMVDFVREATMEIDRINRAQKVTTTDDNRHADVDDKQLYIGDMVHIIDEESRYFGWVAMIDDFTPLHHAKLIIGMPPSSERATDRLCKIARSQRPVDRYVNIKIKKCRLVGRDIP